MRIIFVILVIRYLYCSNYFYDVNKIYYITSIKLSFLKMIHPTNINSAIKQSTYVSISLACFVFVFWQSVQCIEKYIENPQGTKLSLQRTSKLHQFPAITICPAFQMYDEKQLKKCGLRYDKLFIHNT